jgi:hypothetical protein
MKHDMQVLIGKQMVIPGTFNCTFGNRIPEKE